MGVDSVKTFHRLGIPTYSVEHKTVVLTEATRVCVRIRHREADGKDIPVPKIQWRLVPLHTYVESGSSGSRSECIAAERDTRGSWCECRMLVSRW